MSFYPEYSWPIIRAILLISSISLVAAVGILFVDLFKKSGKRELVLLSLISVGSLVVRLRHGLFGVWRAEAHHIYIISNIRDNFLNGSFFRVNHWYNASGGLHEFIYNFFLQFFSEFSVYHIYYVSVAINVLIGIIVYILALQLFQRKDIAFTSLLIYTFTPILIRISASATIFITNALTIPLFAAFAIYCWREKNFSTINSLILFGLFCANMTGRKEIMAMFMGTSFLFLLILLIKDGELRTIFIENNKPKLIILGSLLVSAFYIIYSVIPHAGREIGYRIGWFYPENISVHLNFFRYFSEELTTSAPFFRYTFSPLYFFILLNLTGIILILTKKWKLLFLNFMTVIFLILVANMHVSDFRRVYPFLIFVIPQMAFSFYFILEKMKLKRRYILILSVLIIIPSTYQNSYFLEAEISRKVEQDLIIDLMENHIPEGSLILTAHDIEPHHSPFDRHREGYRYHQSGTKFYNYLIPADKNIDIMDFYLEYDPEAILEYENIFFYKSLYNHHGSWKKYKGGSPRNPDKLAPFEATAKFEEAHTLDPVKTKVVTNRTYNMFTREEFLKGANLTIHAKGDLEIGLYKMDPEEIANIDFDY